MGPQAARFSEQRLAQKQGPEPLCWAVRGALNAKRRRKRGRQAGLTLQPAHSTRQTDSPGCFIAQPSLMWAHGSAANPAPATTHCNCATKHVCNDW